LIVLGVAVAASTSAAQKRAVALMSTDTADRMEPLPEGVPGWLRESRRARSLWTVAKRVTTRMNQDNLMLVAAGIAFYGMFAIFPALGALVSIYGLFGDTHVVQIQVQQLTALLPRETAALLNGSLNALLAKPNANLNSGLLVSLGLAIWGARAGTSSLMSGLNMAVERPEKRSFLAFNLVALGLTFGAIVFAMIALTAVAVVPIVLGVLPLDPTVRMWLAYSRWPMLGAFLLLALDIVYRFGPSRARPHWQFISVGTMFAVAFWILASWIFSLYVTTFGRYDMTYGSLGAVIVLLLWFWLTALIVLLGATIDAVRGELGTP
jgi:membrane protein